jgi:hypothetical protein
METKQRIIDYLIGCNLPNQDISIISSMIELLIIETQRNEQVEQQNAINQLFSKHFN